MRLPDSWRETTVGNVVLDLQPGFAQKPGEEDEGTTPQIRTHNISPDGKITLEGVKHISASAKVSQKYTLTVGDVIFNNTNSEEWVGKTAVFDQDGEYVFSNHMTRLRTHPGLVIPEYLAGYLHLLWSKGYSKTRAKRWVSQAGIESSVLASFKLPLPTLPEQLRIVNLLRQAEGLRNLKQRVCQLSAQTAKALFEQHFGIAGASTNWPMEPFGKHTTYSKYGPRFPDQAYSDTGIHVLRTTDMNDDGTIRWWEAPKLALTEKQIQEHALKPGTLVVSRSGSIGPFALFDGQENQCVAGAYLIEFGLTDSLEPEYVRALFATPYLQQMLRKAVRSVAQPNINAPNIQSIQIPVPSRDRQEAFSVQIKALRAWTRKIADSASKYDELMQAIVGDAFSSELTFRWREQHAAEIDEAAQARDALLRERGAKLSKSAVESKPIPARVAESERPARHWLLGELSEFQRQVLAAFSTYTEQPLLAEDPDVFTRFCDDTEVQQRLQPFGPALNNRIRRTLSQLAALGLIAKVTLPTQNLDTGDRDYLKAFRPLRPEEFTRLSDVAALRKALSASETSYHFTVIADFEASEHAGAEGMFQVAALLDENDQDRTDLVDQGKHYAELDDLAADIARRLGVPASQIVLEG